MVLASFVQLFRPPRCVLCESYGGLICGDCAFTLRGDFAPSCYRCGVLSKQSFTCRKCRSKSVIDALYYVGPYQGALRGAIFAMKFGSRRLLAEPFADILGELFGDFNKEFMVAWVPTSSARIRVRGFDQAGVLARAYARRQGLGVRSLLKKVDGSRQVGKTRPERFRQAFSAYRLRRGVEVPDKVLLIDDVVSSGATVEAVAYELKKAGVKVIIVLCIAKA